jgi:hypothetical protein
VLVDLQGSAIWIFENALVVGDFAMSKSGDEVRDFLRTQLVAFALFSMSVGMCICKNSGRAWSDPNDERGSSQVD